MGKKGSIYIAVFLILALLLAACSNNNAPTTEGSKGNEGEQTKGEGKPATWIADRKIKGLVFMGTDDYTEDMNPEIKAKIKEMTGIELEIEIMKSDRSLDGLVAGLASGDLPDFIAFYLNNSGRPEMPVILKAAREGMFTDLTPMMKNTKVYSKYLQDDYLPLDTKYGVMFRPEFDGSTYFVHMNINREGGATTRKYVGGSYIRKDIVEALNVDPRTIKTSGQLYELAQKIKEGDFKDSNGNSVHPIGPAYWGGKEVEQLYPDLAWGAVDQRIKADKDGKFLHEAQTEFPLKRIEFVQKLLQEKLIHPEFYTIDESRATEAALNGTSAIIADVHNYMEFNNEAHYLPVGPLDKADEPYKMQVDFKSGYSGWAVPSTSKNPEDIVKFADFMASREGKLLWMYGIEGRDYTLDEKGNPKVKQEVLDLKTNDPNGAKKLGFAGVGNYFGELLGATDVDRMADFGEMEYGDSVHPEAAAGANEIIKYWGWDEKRKDARIIDGYPPLSFLGEFAKGTELKTAMDNYDDSVTRAYYTKSLDDAKKIMDSALKQLQTAGLDDYLKLLEQKNADEKTKVKY
ncbi:extracellular solute-binding protein [Paenibacillaceae bacterium]|nr:extracellular solute-binding protein [Paenibacillaceae bacterium]